MTKQAMAAAAEVARQFVQEVDDAVGAHPTDCIQDPIQDPVATGSIRRRSMDLTRALARLRRSNRSGFDGLGRPRPQSYTPPRPR